MVYAFVFAVASPVAERYAALTGLSANLGGALVGTYTFAGVLALALQLLLLTRFGLRVSYVVFAGAMCAGQLMYAFALPARSPALLFVGRAVSGIGAGPLMFVFASAALFSGEERVNATKTLTLVYQVGYAVALLVAGFLELVLGVPRTPEEANSVNAATVPGFLGAACAGALAIGGLLLMPGQTRHGPREPPRAPNEPHGARRGEHGPLLSRAAATGPRAGIVVFNLFCCACLLYTEGVRQVSIYRTALAQWGWALPEISLFGALVFVLIGLSIALFKPLIGPRQQWAALLGSGLSQLAFAPWGAGGWVSVAYLVAAVVYGTCTSAAYSRASARVTAEALKAGPWKNALLAAEVGAGLLGMALGTLVSTLGETPQPWPVLSGSGGVLLCAVLAGLGF
jgi:MFS family permease